MKFAGVLRSLAAAAVCLNLVACAMLQPTAPTPPAAATDSDAPEVISLLEQFDRLADGAIEDQRREFAAAQAAFESAPSELNRLRLALVLSLPRASWHDDARIIGLLGDLAAGPPSLRRQVALLLYRLTIERVRLARDDQRRGERLEASLREEQKKVEDLQQKLGALRAIDRSLRRRP